MALNVHFEENGVAVALLLDVVELAQSHSGANLARVFSQVLEDYNISKKVSIRHVS